MSKRKITIIGAGLYGCLTALKIKSKYKNYYVEIIDSKNDILESLKPVKIENLTINNGFHAIDLPRAQNFFNFLKKKIKINLHIKKQKKFIIIGDDILEENFDLDNKEKKFKKYFLKSNIKTKNYFTLYKNLSSKLQKKMTVCSERYSNDIKNVYHLFIPWFLPKQYELKSSDEGEIFRSKIRNNYVKAYHGFPPKTIFYSIKHKIKKAIKENKINFIENTNVILNGNNLYKNKVEQSSKIRSDKIFLCNAPIFILKKSTKIFSDLTKNKRYLVNLILCINYSFNYFSEILCLNTKFPELSRISYINKKNNQTYLQLEIFLKNPQNCNENFFRNRINKFILTLKTKKKLTKNKIKIIGFKITREIYGPYNNSNLKSEKFVKKVIKDRKLNICGKFPIFPINISKTWIYSDENLKYLK